MKAINLNRFTQAHNIEILGPSNDITISPATGASSIRAGDVIKALQRALGRRCSLAAR